MKVLIINCDFDKNPNTNGGQILKRAIEDYNLEVIISNAFENNLPSVEEIRSCIGVIITGSLESVYNGEEWVKNTIFLIKKLLEIHKQTLGICFGFQAISEALGSKVRKSGSLEEGFCKIEINRQGQNHWLFKGMQKTPYVYQSHGDIIDAIPKGAVLLAKNNFSIQAYTYKNFYCVQFHPEIDAVIAKVMAERDKKVIEENAAISEETYNDSKKLIKNFLEHIKGSEAIRNNKFTKKQII